jgi:hypothetical protein
MVLPFSYSGRVEVGGLHDPKAALLRIEHGLDELRLRRAIRVRQQVQFSAGTFQNLVARTALGAAGSGEVSVQPSKTGLTVTYRIRFTQLFWVSVFMVGFASPFVWNAPNLTTREAATILLGMWLWLYGGNLAVTLFRFPRWLRITVEPS